MSHLLYLLRHGQAQQAADHGVQADFSRELSTAGRQEISRLAQQLAAREDFAPASALVSAATRTRQTAELLPLAGMQLREDYYNADLGALLAGLQTLDEAQPSALVVAHNPGISWLAASLVQPADCPGFSPGSIAALQFDGGWQALKPGCAKLVWRLDPPHYRAK